MRNSQSNTYKALSLQPLDAYTVPVECALGLFVTCFRLVSSVLSHM